MEPQTTKIEGEASPQIEWVAVSGWVLLCLKIIVLRILTLGVYYFWATSETREKVWLSVRIDKHSLEYKGTGLELFLGALKALFFIYIPALFIASFAVIILTAILSSDGGSESIIIVCFYITLFYLFGVGQYAVRHYQLTRTSWRGIRGAMAGNAWDYGITALWSGLLVILTLGWMQPWRSVMLQKILVGQTRFGDEPLTFTGSSKSLYPSFAVMWLGSLATIVLFGVMFYFVHVPYIDTVRENGGEPAWQDFSLALMGVIVAVFAIGWLYAFYTSRRLNYFATQTQLQNAHFTLTTNPVSLMGLVISNGLLIFLTLGIAWPFVQARRMRYLIDRMAVAGLIDFGDIVQSRVLGPNTGEGLAEVVDGSGF